MSSSLNRVVSHRKKSSPVQWIVVSFIIIILTGALLLSMPFSSQTGESTAFIDALFTSASATCVTGLVVFDTLTHWSLAGELIILGLIQLGALGFVTLFTFVTLTFKNKLGLRDVQLIQETTGFLGKGSIVSILRIAVLFTFSCEFLGALLLMTRFVPEFGTRGIYVAVFMAVSSYCNAGFDILGPEKASLSTYNDDPVVIYTLSLLTIIGGLGFIVINDLRTAYLTKDKTPLSLHSKIVFITSAALLIIGFFGFLIFEWDNTFYGFSFGEKINAAFFQSSCTRTAGFASINLDDMHIYTKFLYIAFMFIGAAPGSTAGGIKTTVFVVMVMTVVCVMSGREDTIIGKKRVHRGVVYKSLAIVALALCVILVTTFVLIVSQGEDNISPINALFEAVSAFGTTGSSCNVTSSLNTLSKAFVIFTMFVGRVGPVSLSLAITSKRRGDSLNTILPEANLIVG